MREEGLVAALALGGCSRRSLFRWQAAYERGGLAALIPEPHGPRTRTFKHPAWLAGRDRGPVARTGTPSGSRPSCTRGPAMPGALTLFGKTLRDLQIRHIKTQVNSPWTNGKIEAFWATLKIEVLDRQIFRSIEDAETALALFDRYYNYQRLHVEIGWLTPGERYDGTPFTDRGFENVPALAHLVPWLDELRKAA